MTTTTTTEIPTVKRVRNQSSTPFRTIRQVLENDVNPRYIEYAALYYLQENWLFSSSWAVWTPQREEIDVCEYPGTCHEGFRGSCNGYRNTVCVEPVELLEPVRIEAYVDQKFTGRPGKADRRHVENWIAYEVYPIRGDKTNSLNRRFVDSIRKLSKCRKPKWWRTERDGVFFATDPKSGQLVGILAAVQNEPKEPKKSRKR